MVCDLLWMQEQIPNRHVFENIGLSVQNLITILSLIVNHFSVCVCGRGEGSLCDHLMSMGLFALAMDSVFI